MLTLVSNYDFQ